MYSTGSNSGLHVHASGSLSTELWALMDLITSLFEAEVGHFMSVFQHTRYCPVKSRCQSTWMNGGLHIKPASDLDSMLDWKNESCCQLGNGLCDILNQCPFGCQLGKVEHFPGRRPPRMSWCIALSSECWHPMLEEASLGPREQTRRQSQKVPETYELQMASTSPKLYKHWRWFRGGASGLLSCLEVVWRASGFQFSWVTIHAGWVLMMWLYLGGPCSCK